MRGTGRSSRNRDSNGSSGGAIVLFGFMIGAAYSIYLYGVKVGSGQQFTIPNSLLFEAPVESASEEGEPAPEEQLQQQQSIGAQSQSLPPRSVLDIPPGEAQALPSVRHDDAAIDKIRRVGHTKYGGEGDKEHLGGFTKYDGMGVSPAVWKHMMSYIGVKSLIDVGCGKGVSTLYFAEHGADVLCVEGSHDAVTQTYLPDPENQIVEHDFSRGPYWPKKTYDAVWSVEFLEHVGRNYQYNYIQTFRKAALIFVSHSRWGGWHHVEVHKDEWWLSKFQMFGFQYSPILSDQIKKSGTEEYNRAKARPSLPQNQGPDGKELNAQHVWLTMMVFVNPAVAALPEHAHLMAEPGCYVGRKPGEHSTIIHRNCQAEKKESVLPDNFLPLEVSPEKHNSWMEKIGARVRPKAKVNESV